MRRGTLFIANAFISVVVSAQEVGIGTQTPTARLHVIVPGGYSSPLLKVESASSAQPYFIVQPDGKVGIGTASPSQILDVSGNVQFSGALMPGGNAGNPGQILVSQGVGTPPQWQEPGAGGIAGICLSPVTNFLQKWTGSELCNSIIYDSGANVGIGTSSPHTTALLELKDTTRGILIPRLTTAQRDNITSPAHSLIIFNIDKFCLEVYDSVTTQWYTISCPRQCQPPTCSPSIVGNQVACAGDTLVYKLTGCPPNINGQITWTFPTSWTMVNGQGTDSLVVIPDTTDGLVSVQICNMCGCTPTASIRVIADSCHYFCIAIGGSGTDVGLEIIETSDRGFLAVGYTTSFGNGGEDMYVVKLSPSGTIQWTQVIGGTGNERAYDALETSDGGYLVVGETTSFGTGSRDVYLAKLNSSGAIQWTKTYGGVNDDYGRSIVAVDNSSYAIGGTTSSYGNGAYDFIIIKIDTLGNVIWSKAIGGPNSEVLGFLIKTSDGGFAMSGSSYSFSYGFEDMYVVKLDANGNFIWGKSLGGGRNDWGYRLAETSDGGIAAVGRWEPGSHLPLVAKWDMATGTLQWKHTIVNVGSGRNRGITTSLDGGIVVVGCSAPSFGAGWNDILLSKFKNDGTLVWTRSIGGPLNDCDWEVMGLTATSDGGYAIATYTQSFGSGGWDMYIVKVKGDGTLPCSTGCIVGSGGSTGGGPNELSGGASTTASPSTNTGGSAASGGNVTYICP